MLSFYKQFSTFLFTRISLENLLSKFKAQEIGIFQIIKVLIDGSINKRDPIKDVRTKQLAKNTKTQL